jgi:DNA-directed RNA polymerase subunit K/omega
MAPFNFASIPASSDPVVRYTVEQAMAQVRGADKKTRYMLMIEAAARQLAFQIALYEETVQEEQQQQGPPPAVMNEPDVP